MKYIYLISYAKFPDKQRPIPKGAKKVLNRLCHWLRIFCLENFRRYEKAECNSVVRFCNLYEISHFSNAFYLQFTISPQIYQNILSWSWYVLSTSLHSMPNKGLDQGCFSVRNSRKLSKEFTTIKDHVSVLEIFHCCS